MCFPMTFVSYTAKVALRSWLTFDGVEYHGSIVNMGLKNLDGSICYILGITKNIRGQIHKEIGDFVAVKIEVLL